jgi:hypothetical protein
MESEGSDSDTGFGDEWMPPSEPSDYGSSGEEAMPQSDSESEDDYDASESDSASSEEEEGDSSADEEEVRAEDEGNKPIYEGAPITVHESLLAIFSLAIAEHMSGVLLGKVLELVSLHCPINSLCRKSLHMLKKYFSKVGNSILIFHYFCSDCVWPLQSKQSQCNKCLKSGNVSYFIEMPLMQQLQVLFKRPRFYDDLQYRFRRNGDPSCIRDIYDGRLYKEQIESGFLSNPHNVSFMWWTDGLQIFKSSIISSIWPLCLVINELEYKKRILPRNIVLCGLWVGKAQPNPNMFLKPLMKSMKVFSTVGASMKLHDNTEILVKGKIICGTCDLPAKSKFMRFKQFNGSSSCAKCLATGARYRVGKKATVQVFPFTRNAVPRTHEQVQDFAQQAVNLRIAGEKDASVHGVKGPSLLSRLLPDVIRGMAIDVMHGAFLGVCKWLTFLWFDSRFSTFPWSLHASIDIIDERIRKMKPPSFAQRPLRSIKSALAIWKASEYKLFLLYYSVPVLLGIMDDEYFNHHCKLVSAISLLCRDSISMDCIRHAAELLQSYLSDFARLYHLRYLGMVFHQLSHLHEVVLDCGPLWVTSCFFLESLNGKLGKLFHGTRHVAMQICSSVKLVMEMPLMVESLPEDSRVKQFCKNVTFRKDKHKIADRINDDTLAIGTYSDKPLVVESSKCLLRNYVGQPITGSIRVFYRLKSKGVMYFSQEYSRAANGKKESSFVSTIYDGVPCIARIIRFIKWKTCTPQCDRHCQGNCVSRYFCIVREYSQIHWYPHDNPVIRLPHMSKIQSTTNVFAVSVEAIACLLFYMKTEENEYIARPINRVEPE